MSNEFERAKVRLEVVHLAVLLLEQTQLRSNEYLHGYTAFTCTSTFTCRGILRGPLYHVSARVCMHTVSRHMNEACNNEIMEQREGSKKRDIQARDWQSKCGVLLLQFVPFV